MIDHQHREDINLPNQPFPLFGRMLPSYQDGCWSYRTERFPPEAVSEMCFPDEQYDFDALSQNSIFVGAYDSGHCVGLAILQHSPFRYLYLYDLKVNREMRGRHIGTLLIRPRRLPFSRDTGESTPSVRTTTSPPACSTCKMALSSAGWTPTSTAAPRRREKRISTSTAICLRLAPPHQKGRNQMPETTPLFQTQTTYTFAEYRRYSRALQNKVMHRPLVIAVMMACLVLLALLSDDNSMRVAFLIVAVLTPLIFSLIGSRMEKKAYYANTAMQDVVLTYSFYPDHVETNNTLGFTTIPYDKLYRVVETPTNFYLLIARNQGMVIVKENCSAELIAFLQKLGK